VGGQLGVDAALGGCSPADKLDHLRALQAQGARTAMVGDGLNDGPVLAAAQVSFAFGRAVPLAQAQSDFVVLGERLLAGGPPAGGAHGGCGQAESGLGHGLQRRRRADGHGGVDAGLGRGPGHGRQFAGGGAQRAAAVAWHGWGVGLMDVLYVLIPLSVVLVFLCWERSAGPFIGASSRMWNARAAHSRERLTHVNVSMTQLRILLRG
jgi:hypothetical protein